MGRVRWALLRVVCPLVTLCAAAMSKSKASNRFVARQEPRSCYACMHQRTRRRALHDAPNAEDALGTTRATVDQGARRKDKRVDAFRNNSKMWDEGS
jgi:hypothetical protein